MHCFAPSRFQGFAHGNAVCTTGVVLWMPVSQRMAPERSLESVVKRLIDTQPDFLPRNKCLTEKTLSKTEKTLSKATGGYSRTRSRLQRDAVQWFAERVRDSLIEATAPSFDQRRVDAGTGPPLR